MLPKTDWWLMSLLCVPLQASDFSKSPRLLFYDVQLFPRDRALDGMLNLQLDCPSASPHWSRVNFPARQSSSLPYCGKLVWDAHSAVVLKPNSDNSFPCLRTLTVKTISQQFLPRSDISRQKWFFQSVPIPSQYNIVYIALKSLT